MKIVATLAVACFFICINAMDTNKGEVIVEPMLSPETLKSHITKSPLIAETTKALSIGKTDNPQISQIIRELQIPGSTSSETISIAQAVRALYKLDGCALLLDKDLAKFKQQ